MVSIIVPVYNSENHLKRCLDSIVGQSYQEIEILLIDDGSTDKSPSICDEYAVYDSRIKVVHKKNEGVSIARNTGVDLSHGEWIAFVDSDDWLESDYLSTLIRYSHKADIIICNCSKIKYYQEADIAKFIDSDVRNVSCTACHQKIIRSSLIKDNNVRFSSRFKFGEDTLFSLDLLQYCDRIQLINYQGYHVTPSDTLVSEKYNQSIQDIHDKNRAIQSIHERLGHRFNKCFDITYDIRMTIMMFPMERILNGESQKYEQLWLSYFPNSSVEVLFNDRHCSPLIRSITYMKFLAMQDINKELYSVIKHCYSLWGDTYCQIKYPYVTHSKIGKLIGNKHFLVCWLYLLFYVKLKRCPSPFSSPIVAPN